MAADSVAGDVVAKAREFLGAPFQQRGRSKQLGIDCVGLVLCVGEELALRYVDGRPVRRSDYRAYGLLPVADELQLEVAKIFVRKDRGQIAAGDIVTFDLDAGLQHIGIVGDLQGRLSVIHACNSVQRSRGSLRLGKVVEHRLDIRKVAGVFCFAGPAD